MSDGMDPRDADIEEATSRLDEGLKSCRSVVDHYRTMLGGNNNDGDVANDAGPTWHDGDSTPDSEQAG